MFATCAVRRNLRQQIFFAEYPVSLIFLRSYCCLREFLTLYWTGCN